MFGYLVIAATIAFFYKAGDMADDEKICGRKRRRWAMISAMLWCASFHLLGWGTLMGLIPQIALFLVLTAKGTHEGLASEEKMKANVAAALKRRDRQLQGR